MPDVARSRQPSTCSSVLLPEPDGPTMASRLAGLDAQVHAAQRLDATCVCLAHVDQFDDGGSIVSTAMVSLTAPPPRCHPRRARRR